MGVIKLKDNKTYWSKARTVPNPLLVEGILKYIKENKEVKVQDKPVRQTLCFTGYNPVYTSCSLDY